jgi:Fe-S cluster biosynthesis and repair protein YggX
MKSIEKIYSFLKSNGFKLIEKDVSEFFGDHYDLFIKGSIQLRFGSSKCFETVDIRSNLSNENWYDLALVRALLYDEKNLNKVTTIDEHGDFLQKELTNIDKVFDNRHYLTTKRRLDELGDKRAEQMFPGMKK